MIDYKAIGRRISMYRKKKGLTQTAFAEKLGVSDSYVSQVERGINKISLPRLDEIAEILGVDITLLISDHMGSTEKSINSEIHEITKEWSEDQTNFLIDLLNCADEQFKSKDKE